MKSICAVLLCLCLLENLAGGAVGDDPPQPRSAEKARGSGGLPFRVAVLADDLPGGRGAAPPEKVAALAGELGCKVALLNAEEAADPAVFNRGRFDVLVVPCAPAYPYHGRAALLDFLKQGGSLVSIGGYAFDHPVVRTGDGWTPAGDAGDPPPWINTRYGRPGDTLRLGPDQIGAFDPSYLLKHVDYAATAPGQDLFRQPLRFAGPLEGYAACVVAGNHSPVFPEVYCRWIPILNAYDAFGRLRGAVAAVAHHFRGPFRGSSWALLGVTNRDLVGGDAAGGALFAAALRAVAGPAFLHGLATDFACYRQGETVEVSVRVANHGPAPRRLTVQLAAEGLPPVSRHVSLDAQAAQTVSARLLDGRFERDFYRVAAELVDAETGRPVDRMTTGFVVWNEQVIRAGPKIALRDNYFTIDGVPQFLCGSNQTGMMWHSENENPLVWQEDFAGMQSSGMRMLRILHFSPFAADDPPRWRRQGTAVLQSRPKRLRRQTDAIVQLAQKHRVVVFLSLHDWMPVELPETGLEYQRAWNRFWAERYRDVPGMIYDVQNEPTVGLTQQPELVRFYNDWLKARYGTWEALKTAWGRSAPPGDAWTLLPQRGSDAWNDVKTFDAECFRAAVLNRWIKANVEGVKQGDPEALVTVGFLQFMAPADKILGTRHTDLSNMHYHGDVDQFPPRLKIIDRRFLGKSFSLGEFGAMEAHAARNRGRDGTAPEASIRRFLTLTHYTFGLGGSHALSWDWKDFDACVFPWGLNHPCDGVGKPVLDAFRNTSLFLERLRPRYEDPGLYLLLPDSLRLGARAAEVHAAVYRTVDALLANHVDFNVANEYDLGRLPPTCRVMVWPVPYCPDDDAFRRVLEFVRAGGTLYLSGDVAYDPLRRPTRTGRFQELSRKGRGPRPPFAGPVTASPGAIQRLAVGQGKVFYVPDPVELEGGPLNETMRQFLDYAGVRRTAVLPDDPKLHVFTLPLADGAVTLLCNRTGAARDVSLAGAEITVGKGLTGLVVSNGRGELTGLECTGRSAYGKKPLTAGSAHVIIASRDGRDLRHSKRLLLFPFSRGTLTVQTAADWRRAVLDAGEPAGASWKTLAEVPLPVESGALRIEIDENLARSILLVREEDAPPGPP